MSWNYRILKVRHRGKTSSNIKYDETIYKMIEVYYKNGKIVAWGAASFQSNSKAGLKWTLEKYKEAIEKPILQMKDLPK